uniref:Mitochondrial minicircle DNA n=1 Tax=Strigomonas oncopelti TaxID=5657 RepID=Q34194_STROO|nr:unnamed protein product [Strigomonas oncopelti]
MRVNRDCVVCVHLEIVISEVVVDISLCWVCNTPKAPLSSCNLSRSQFWLITGCEDKMSSNRSGCAADKQIIDLNITLSLYLQFLYFVLCYKLECWVFTRIGEYIYPAWLGLGGEAHSSYCP